MAVRHGSHRAGWLLKLALLWFAGAIAMAPVGLYSALAEAAEGAWDAPVNLSQSGAATNPAIVVDSNAAMHVLWQDAFANYVYARLEAGQWSAPQPTDLHRRFGVPVEQPPTGESEAPTTANPNPLLVAGPNSLIFAFWITPEGRLYDSRVANGDFVDSGAWTVSHLLSPSAIAVAAAVDARGDLQVVYLRTTAAPASPAGIYHTRSIDNGRNWTAPVLLYASPYFRSLTGAEANLSLVTTGTVDTPVLYVAWDNQPRKQLFLRLSRDGGVNWEDPVTVAGPAPDSGPVGPFNSRIGALDNHVVLVWQVGEPGGPCSQYYRSSGDAGTTWTQAQLMFEGQSGCAKSNQFVPGGVANVGGWLYLLTEVSNQTFLSVWNGSRWSEPQLQESLAGFEDPETYLSVVYDCLRSTWLAERLYLVGCDRGAGGDIWVTSQAVVVDEAWFSVKVWSLPTLVTTETLDVIDVKLVATRDDLIHAFVTQRLDPAIYYTRWDGTTWSRITPAMKAPDLEVSAPGVASGPGNELMLVARSSGGALYASRANSRDALTTSSWSTPARLPIPHDGRVSQADVEWDLAGTIYVAYSVAVNDERGIYLITSGDQGQTWSEPLQVFDGSAAGFAVVGSPTLLAPGNDQVHIIWKRESAPVDGVARTLSLHYARSEDAGATFSEVEQVAAGSVVWQAIMADGRGQLHRLWQLPETLTTIWDQVSLDSGRSWEIAQRLPTDGGAAALTLDPAGRLQLVSGSLGLVGHWIWDGGRWGADTPLRWTLGAQDGGPVAALAAAVNMDGKLIVVLADLDEAGDEPARRLLFATRTLDLPPIVIADQATPTQAPSATLVMSPTPAAPVLTPAATAASEAEPTQTPVSGSAGSDPITSYALILWPVALLLVAAFGAWAVRALWVKAQ